MTGEKVIHVALIAAWSLVALGLASEFGTDQNNAALPWIFFVWIAFGIWRVVRMYQHKRGEQHARLT